MTDRIAGAVVVASALVAAGCSVGRDNVVFVTKTNVAIDIDSTPPALDLGYKRTEMVIEPVDKNGRVLPVLTTVGTRPGAFNWGASHSFATGDAAIVMARYYLTEAELESPENNTIKLTDLDDIDGNAISTNSADREAFFFGTNTIIGLGVTWDTSQIPQSVALGYKRKEVAIVPITAKKGKKKGKTAGTGTTTGTSMGTGTEDENVAELASLIATAQAASSVKKMEATGFEVSQSFATGRAATLLATHPSLRRVLGAAIIPKAEEADALKNQVADMADQGALAAAVIKAHKDAVAANDPTKAAAIRTKAAAMPAFRGDGLDASNFEARVMEYADGTAAHTKPLQDLAAAFR